MYNKMQFQNSQTVSNVLQKDGETSEVLMAIFCKLQIQNSSYDEATANKTLGVFR